jgi:DnaK suppressor protein
VAKKASPRKSATGKSGKVAKTSHGPAAGAKAARKKAIGGTKAVNYSAGKSKVKTSPKSTAPAKKTAPAGKAAKPAAKPAVKPAAPTTPRTSLTSQELKEFRRLLLAKRRELVGDMTGIEAEALGADRQESKGDISDHPADAGTDNFEQEFSLGLLESERNMLAEIDQALTRIDRGTFGICLGTGKQISKARLSARPWAPYGIEYARMIEKGLVRAGERVASEHPGDETEDDEEEDGDSESEGGAERDFEPEDREEREADHEDDEAGYDE